MKKQITNFALNTMMCLMVSFLLNSGEAFAQFVGAGDNTTFYICGDGSVAATGANPEGQLGNGTIVDAHSPASNGLTNIIKASGAYHTLFLKSDGTVWACGQNYGGQLGNGTYNNTSTPVQVSGLTGIIDIFATDGFSMFLKSDSTVWTCGPNSNGELGDGTTIDHTTPVQVTGLTGIVAIAGGGMHSLFLKSNGNVYSCGYNLYGQLGNGANSTSPSPTPTLIGGISNVVAIGAGNQQSLFVKNDGTAWGCGYNSNGELGTSGGHNVPTQITTLSNIKSVSCGRYHTAFLKTDGTVWSCGLNNSGQLGNGTTTNSVTPIQSTGLSGITQIASGYFHTLCLKSDDTYWAFGSNVSGQLGNGTTTNSLSAVQISTGCSGGPTAPSAPTSLTITPLRMSSASGYMGLTWTDNSTSELGFRVERSIDGSAWTAVDSTLSNIASFTDSTTLGGSLYYYRVAAFNAGGLSAYSNTVSATTLVSGIISEGDIHSFSLSPNPCKGSFNVKGINGLFAISVYDLCGRLVLEHAGDYEMLINAASLAPGIYAVSISNYNKEVQRKLLIVE